MSGNGGARVKYRILVNGLLSFETESAERALLRYVREKETFNFVDGVDISLEVRE